MTKTAQARFLGPFRPLPGARPPRLRSRDRKLDEFDLVLTPPRTIPGLWLEHQRSSNWCWASVTAGVLRCLRNVNENQDQVAQQVLGPQYPADLPMLLMNALGPVGIQSPSGPWTGFDFSPQGFDQYIRPELDAGRPVCAQIRYPNQSFTHFLVVCGYAVSGPTAIYLYIQDPADANPPAVTHGVSLQDAKTCRPGGVWSWTYTTA